MPPPSAIGPVACGIGVLAKLTGPRRATGRAILAWEDAAKLTEIYEESVSVRKLIQGAGANLPFSLFGQ